MLSGKVGESTIICIEVEVFSHFSKLNDGGDSTRIGGNSIKNDDEVVTPLIGREKVVTPSRMMMMLLPHCKVG